MKLTWFVFFYFISHGLLFCGELIQKTNQKSFLVEPMDKEINIDGKEYNFNFFPATITINNSLLKESEFNKDTTLLYIEKDLFPPLVHIESIDGKWYIALEKDIIFSLYLWHGTNEITKVPTISQIEKGQMINQNLLKFSIPNIWDYYPDYTFEPRKIIHYVADMYKLYEKIKSQNNSNQYKHNIETICTIFIHWILFAEAYFYQEEELFHSRAIYEGESIGKDFEPWLITNMKKALQLQCELKGISFQKDGINLIERATTLDELKTIIVSLRNNKQFPSHDVLPTKIFGNKFILIAIPSILLTVLGYALYKYRLRLNK